jgi:hypothetical protein
VSLFVKTFDIVEYIHTYTHTIAHKINIMQFFSRSICSSFSLSLSLVKPTRTLCREVLHFSIVPFTIHASSVSNLSGIAIGVYTIINVFSRTQHAGIRQA